MGSWRAPFPLHLLQVCSPCSAEASAPCALQPCSADPQSFGLCVSLHGGTPPALTGTCSQVQGWGREAGGTLLLQVPPHRSRPRSALCPGAGGASDVLQLLAVQCEGPKTTLRFNDSLGLSSAKLTYDL